MVVDDARERSDLSMDARGDLVLDRPLGVDALRAAAKDLPLSECDRLTSEDGFDV